MSRLISQPLLFLQDRDGRPVNGAKCETFASGTSEHVVTYQDSLLTVPHANPITSLNNGYFPAIYSAPGIGIKLILSDPAGAAPSQTIDPATTFVLTQEEVGVVLHPLTDAEDSADVEPDDYASPRGYSARYGEPDEAAFGGNFTAMYGLKPWGGAPAAYGGFVINAPEGRFNIGNNWTSATGVHRQMYATGYATMIQGDANGDIGLYTYGTSVAQGANWQPKYSFILRANGQQWLNSNGANRTWQQLISTGANTDDQGYGTDRLTWGCVATVSDIITGADVGDVCWSLHTASSAFQWSVDSGATYSMQITAANYFLNAATGSTSVSWEYRIGNSTKGYIGFAGTAGGLLADSQPNDIVIRGIASFRVTTNGGTSSTFIVDNAGAVYVPAVGTTASAANCFIDNAASGSILRSTSSLRYKADVEPLADDVADRVLRMQPIKFRSLCEADHKDWTYYGLAAEEVAAIDPRFCFFDGEGRPDGVQYDRLVVPLLQIIKRLSARVEALEAQAR